MKEKKYQIFVSSTFSDLVEERQAAVEAILSAGNIPAGMELFSAGDESQMSVIKRWIDESDIYLLILGGRYGSIEEKSKKSYTQLEYEYAVEKNKPLFSIVMNKIALEEKVKEKGTSVIEMENPQKLEEFRKNVLQNLVKFWDDKKDIKIAIHETLSDFTYRKDLVGWIRGDNSINTGFLAEEIAKLTKENSELRDSIKLSQTDTSGRYSSLTFSELKSLIENEIVKFDNKEVSLYNFMLNEGKNLITGVTEPGNETPYIELKKYKIIRNLAVGFTRYGFTEDGHNFYLKALTKK